MQLDVFARTPYLAISLKHISKHHFQAELSKNTTNVINIESTWTDVASRYTTDGILINRLWQEIEGAYTRSNRYYHNLNHLQYMMEKMFEHKSRLKAPDIVLFAIFYHDIVYNTTKQDNELQSAEFAGSRLKELGVATKQIEACKKQILATKDHQAQGDNDVKYLIDFDLAILGDTPELYNSYSENIRKEYAKYPNFL